MSVRQQTLNADEAAAKAEDNGQSGDSFAKRVDQAHSAEAAPLVIGGEEIHSADSFAVYDPSEPDQVVGYAAAATLDQSLKAVEAADRAWKDWAALTPEKRAQMLVDALDGLSDVADENAQLLCRENGKALFECKIEMAVFEGRCRLAAGLASEMTGRERTLKPEPEGSSPHPIRYTSEVAPLPLGVVSIIVPYNWPLAILAASLPYALVAGNACIVKPPPTAPLAMTRVLQHVASRLPAGVLNVVSGSNENMAPLITDRRVGKLVFTGSTGAGKRMMQMCSDNLARLCLELGGNDPAIVLDDAELDEAALQRLVTATFLTTGQVCMALKRLYVHRSRYDEVVEGMGKLLENYKVGPGLGGEANMGPLHTAAQKAYVEQLRKEAEDAGCEVREFGQILNSANPAGHYLKPALVLDPDPSLNVVDQEQFGPILPILPFDDVDPLVDAVNDHWSGLCSSVWSGDVDRAAGVARRLRTGTVWINNANAVGQDDRAPFGGFRMSGVGRELGVEGLFAFTEPRTITFRPEGGDGH